MTQSAGGPLGGMGKTRAVLIGTRADSIQDRPAEVPQSLGEWALLIIPKGDISQ